MLARCNRVRYGFSLKYLSENVSGPFSSFLRTFSLFSFSRCSSYQYRGLSAPAPSPACASRRTIIAGPLISVCSRIGTSVKVIVVSRLCGALLGR